MTNKTINDLLWKLRDSLMSEGFYTVAIFKDLYEIQSLVSQAEFDVHRLSLEVEHLRAENMRLEVAKAMLEPDKEYKWYIEDKFGQEELQAEFETELRVAI